jgi:hypothetical protein
MAENKTQPTQLSALDFVQSVENKQRKADALVLLDIFAQVTKQQALLGALVLLDMVHTAIKLRIKKRSNLCVQGFPLVSKIWRCILWWDLSSLKKK